MSFEFIVLSFAQSAGSEGLDLRKGCACSLNGFPPQRSRRTPSSPQRWFSCPKSSPNSDNHVGLNSRYRKRTFVGAFVIFVVFVFQIHRHQSLGSMRRCVNLRFCGRPPKIHRASRVRSGGSAHRTCRLPARCRRSFWGHRMGWRSVDQRRRQPGKPHRPTSRS